MTSDTMKHIFMIYTDGSVISIRTKNNSLRSIIKVYKMCFQAKDHGPIIWKSYCYQKKVRKALRGLPLSIGKSS